MITKRKFKINNNRCLNKCSMYTNSIKKKIQINEVIKTIIFLLLSVKMAQNVYNILAIDQ